MESKILSQATKDLKKIENIKQQFRQQVQGGVFFNQLRNLSEENIKNRVK